MSQVDLTALSQRLADIVAQAGRAVVAVQGHSRVAAGGIHWEPGVIVTADHLLRRDDEIHVTLPDGNTAQATLAGRDPGTDVAVLRLDRTDLPTFERAPAELRPGHLVLGIGRSAEAGVRAALGMLSGVSGSWRTWRGGQLDQFLRLDLALYPGTSGSAVIDTEGRLIGMATAGLNRAAGVAVPATTLERVTAQLLTKGRIARGYLGVGLQPVVLPERLRGKLGIGETSGLIVLSVERQGPAEAAGLLVGDILVRIENRSLADTDDVMTALGPDSVGKAITLFVVRGGEVANVALTVGERPPREK